MDSGRPCRSADPGGGGDHGFRRRQKRLWPGTGGPAPALTVPMQTKIKMVSVTAGKRSAQKRKCWGDLDADGICDRCGAAWGEDGCQGDRNGDGVCDYAGSGCAYARGRQSGRPFRRLPRRSPGSSSVKIIIQSTAKETAAAARKSAAAAVFSFLPAGPGRRRRRQFSASVVNQEKLNRTAPWFWVPRA